MRRIYRIDPRLHIEKLEEVVDEPKVIRVNEFDEEALDKFEKDLDEAHMTGQPVIPIIVDSYGGSAYGLLGMVAAVESCKVPVATILTSKAMSAGALLFCFGTHGYRYMHSHATMMIHDVGSIAVGKVEDIKADAKHLDELNETMYKRVSKHLGHNPNYIRDLIKQHNHVDWFLTAKDCKKHNIANHLCVPSFEVDITLRVTFG